MSAFSDFMVAFTKYKNDNNLSFPIEECMGYYWRIGSTLVGKMKTHLDNTDQIDEQRKIAFREMFTAGKDLLNIPYMGELGDDLTNTAILYKLKRQKTNKLFSDVEFKIRDYLCSPMRIQDPVTGAMFYPKYYIQGNNVSIQDSHTTYNDALGDENSAGEKMGDWVVSDKIIACSGTVNYRTAEFRLNRDLEKNIDIAKQVTQDYNELIDMTYIPWASTRDGTSGSSSFSSSDEASVKPNYVYYYTDNYNVSFVQFVAPSTVVWKWEYTGTE